MNVLKTNSAYSRRLCLDLNRYGIIAPSSMVIVGENIYIAGQYSHKIYSLNKNSHDVEVFFDNLSYPTDICADDESSLWITDRWNHNVKRISLNGDLLLSLGEYGNGPGKFSEPWGIGYYNGFVAVSDRNNHRIQIFDKKGAYIRSFGVQGPEKEYYESDEFKKGFIFEQWIQSSSRFCNTDTYFFKENYKIGSIEYPLNIDICTQGDIIAVDSGNDRIQLFGFEGQLKRSYSKEKKEIPFDLVIDSLFLNENTFLVSSEFCDTVFAMDITGNIVFSIKEEGARLNYLYLTDNEIWVLDSWNSKLYKFVCG